MVEGPLMTEREKILARVREALAHPAPVPGRDHDGNHVAPAVAVSPQDARRFLPLVGESFEERLALFRKNATDLRAEFCLFNSPEELSPKLIELRDREGWKRVGAHGGELASEACKALGLSVCRTDQTYAVSELETCDVGISECDALIAQTGSVLVTSRSAGGRALSVLPPHHVVLARRTQLLRDLPEAFALLKQKYGSGYPSFISFITGPSRTGDIERILVLGAHGPKKLTICCF
jgi:L-lactate dehydrogenase complex protein LldG